jgi:hypothetical protein
MGFKDVRLIKDHYAENWLNHATLAFMDWMGNAPHRAPLRYNYLSRKEWKQAFRSASLFEEIVETDLALVCGCVSICVVPIYFFVVGCGRRRCLRLPEFRAPISR